VLNGIINSDIELPCLELLRIGKHEEWDIGYLSPRVSQFCTQEWQDIWDCCSGTLSECRFCPS